MHVLSSSVIHKFEEHLKTNCGVTCGTIDLFKWHVVKFLTTRFGDPAKIDLKALEPGDFIKYIMELAPRYTPNTRKASVTALRSFLRWLQLSCQCTSQLVKAVPTVSSRRLSGVPIHLSEAQLATFLNSFDLGKPTGLRGYAAALCMARLGLRVGEVAQLTLDDIDWREGILRINKSKSRRINIFPLSREVGAAILEYLRHGRPPTAVRNIFVRNPGHPLSGNPRHPTRPPIQKQDSIRTAWIY